MDMSTSKHTEKQIIGFLRQAEAGMPIKAGHPDDGACFADGLQERAAYPALGPSRPAYAARGSLRLPAVIGKTLVAFTVFTPPRGNTLSPFPHHSIP